jgi:hypothetical protein
MILPSCFDNFIARSPISVMMRATIENVCGPGRLNAIFEQTASVQYTRRLEFATVAELVSQVVFDTSASISAAYQSRDAAIAVSRKSFYNKLNGVEAAVSAALVNQTVGDLDGLIGAMDAHLPSLLPGYRVRIIDGNHLSASEHRIKELRTTAGAPLPGNALVVFDPQSKLARHVIPCEDAHASERALFEKVLPLVQSGEVWVADRNFCTTALMQGIAARGACFVIRQHGSLIGTPIGPVVACGGCSSGAVFEQQLQIEDARTHQTLRLRRITIALKKPTRDGQRELHVLSNVPATAATAAELADLYAKRWKIETMFQELTETLCCEIKTLGYPKAALLGLCLALLAYNVIAVIKAALRAAHGAETVETQVSGYYIAEEIARIYGGMMIAIAETEWQVFSTLTAAQMAALLVEWAAKARLAKYQKHPRGPKKPRPPRVVGTSNHVSTARILAQRKSK